MNQIGYADLKNESIIDADSLVINTLTLPNLDANSVAYIDSSNNLSDIVLSNGQLVIGRTSNAPVANTLTGTTDEINITNGSGTITLSTPQPIATTSSPTFANITVNNVYGASPEPAILIGPGSNTGTIVIATDTNTNTTNNSIVIGKSNLVNIRPNAALCDLGSNGAPWQTIYLSGQVHGNSFTRLADDILSLPGSQTAGNLLSSAILNKVAQDSGITASNVVTNAGTGATGDVCVFASGTGKVIQDSNIVSANLVTNGSTGATGDVCIFSNGTGKDIKDSNISSSNLFLADGTVAMTGDINLNGNDLTNADEIKFTGTSIRVGKGTSVNASAATAVGNNSLANGTNSIAIGSNANSSTTDCIAIGRDNQSTNPFALSLGYNNLAKFSNQVMIGTQNTGATGAQYAVVIGNNSKSNNFAAITIAAGNIGSTNSTSQSVLFGDTGIVNIRPDNNNACDLGTSTNKFKDIYVGGNVTALGTPSSGVLTNCTGLPVSTGISGLGTGVATMLGTFSSANIASACTDETGSGALTFATSPTLVTPLLGTPTSGTLTNCTGLPVSSGISGLGTGVATMLGTFSSANIASACTDETGSGALTFATSPTLVTPTLGAASATSLTFSSTSGIIGSTTNDNAAAGSVGELLEVTDSKVSGITSGTSINATTNGLTLTAGDWDVWGSLEILPSSTVTIVKASITSSSGTLGASFNHGAYIEQHLPWASGSTNDFLVGQRRFSLSASTTIYIVANITFAGTCGLVGYIGARRVR